MRVASILGVCGLAGLLVLVGVAAWHRQEWRQEMHAQCAAASPLVNRHAQREDVIDILGRPSSEHAASELADLAHAFGEDSPKAAALRANLRGSNTLLLYSRSNSVMFVYLGGDKRTIGAECFLQ